MYGIITEKDKISLERAMDLVMDTFSPANKIRVLEIGVCRGDTSRGINQYFSNKGRDVEYWGVDNGKDLKVSPPFEGANLVLGESSEIHHKIPGTFYFLFIDGCHCANHVMLDFLNYGRKLEIGGIVVFHDVSPAAQNKHDYQGHGDRTFHETGTASRTALYRLGLETSKTPGFRTDWKLVFEDWDDHSDWGGIGVYQRIK